VDVRVYDRVANLTGKSGFQGLSLALSFSDKGKQEWPRQIKWFVECITIRNETNAAKVRAQNDVYDKSFEVLDRALALSRPHDKARFHNKQFDVSGQFDSSGLVSSLIFKNLNPLTAFELLEVFRKMEVDK
jgi:hypothetical protein